MYEIIINNTKTQDELEKLTHEVDLLIESCYAIKQNFDKALKDDVRDWVANEILAEIKLLNIDRSDYLAGLRKRLKNPSIMELTMPYEPSQSDIGLIENWLNNNVSQDTILNLKYDPAIVAGVQIAYKGKYANYSWNEKIDKLIEEYRGDIKTILEKYVG